ncbi:putative dehydrogenase [Actinoalloteichus hoggarensis]|uniref:Putative oxidoreductase YdgJ n=1 Tax=Actinoalloteichus hoggarensis TaxID=1470176 RepID=A0A221VWH9_9PSEU|nr:Gfo/Idh/MocA family oxidoreductase [Actinoalloteichus hoggarensis]ASO17906.1 putative oxidoreductase YdgJ [Actinoalloteichus hoggarensis]MBB5924317.1 putative dehydrogenase [Actinoalloteichus hoggarensis]
MEAHENTADRQLRVGLIGAGPWARAIHAPGIADHPGTRLTSVWARRPSAAAEIAGPYCAEVADDPASLFGSVDAVAFAVPPDVQAELATSAARRGRHLILEKPLALSLADAQRLADTAADNDVVTLVLLTRRFASDVRSWLGEIAELPGWQGGSVRWISGGLLKGPFAGSPWRHAEDGGLFDVGPHAVDLIDAALGPVTDVVAAHRTPSGVWQLVLDHQGGASSTVTMSMHTPVRPSVNELTVFGEQGHREFRGTAVEPSDSYTALLDDFVAMVHSGLRDHPCDVRRGLHLQRVLASAREVART